MHCELPLAGEELRHKMIDNHDTRSKTIEAKRSCFFVCLYFQLIIHLQRRLARTSE